MRTAAPPAGSVGRATAGRRTMMDLRHDRTLASEVGMPARRLDVNRENWLLLAPLRKFASGRDEFLQCILRFDHRAHQCVDTDGQQVSNFCLGLGTANLG